MNKEMNTIFIKNLKEKLKQKVKELISVEIKPNNQLYVKIMKFEGFTFTWYKDDITENIIYGYSVDKAAEEIVRAYSVCMTKKLLEGYFTQSISLLFLRRYINYENENR